MFYMKEKREKLTTIRVLLHKTFYDYWSKILPFPCMLYLDLSPFLQLSVVWNLRIVPMSEILYDTTQQQTQ